MKQSDALGQMLSAAFRGGELTTRELRLSSEERAHIARAYPALSVLPMGGPSSGGKQWFRLCCEPAPPGGQA